MKEIPQHCIDTFKERFKCYPSIIEVSPTMNEENTDKLFGKSHLLWFDYFVNNENKIVYRDRLCEYDSSGVLILRKSNNEIFILTKVDKQNVVDYLLLQIKRLTTKKD
jgi:hypothetical protein